MRGFGRFVLIMAIIWVVMIVISILAIFPVYRDIDATINRAQLAADAERMVTYVDEVTNNMERRGITQGSAAMIFKTPVNDIGLNYQALKDLRDRAKLISKMPKDSVEYQTGLDDMRGTLREIDVKAAYYAAWHNIFVWLASLIPIIGLTIGITLWIKGT